MTLQRESSPWGARRWMAVALGVTLLGGGTFLFRGCSSVDGVSIGSKKTAVAGADRIEIPKFGRPEEAKRYFDAMTDGDQRSLQLIEHALTAARSDPNADPKYIAELERERSAREARLKAYQAARGTLATGERAE
jgi:hypothetical protein